MTTPETPAKTPSMGRTLMIDFGPLLIFFAAFKFGGLMVATGAFMVATLIAMGVSKVFDGKIPPMLWFNAAIVFTMGSLTLYLNDETFVKMKPTIIYGVFAAVLSFGLLTKRPLIKLVLEAGIPPLEERGWFILTRNFTLFFAAMALFNEIVWRTQTTDLWVTIKTFGFIPAFLIFVMTQAPVMMKYEIKQDGGDA